MTEPLKILSLGWGVQSWTLAAMSALGDLPPVDYAIHADTTHEAQATYTHAAKWTPWLEERGVKVVTVTAPETDVIQQGPTSRAVMIPAFSLDPHNMQTGQIRRQCTGDWKIDPIRKFLRTVVKPRPGAVESWQGISYDEWRRMRDSDVRYIQNIYPLVDRKITRAGCIQWLEQHGLDVPPKSACTFCPYHGQDAWRTFKRRGGKDWDEIVAADDSIRNLRPNHVLYIHPKRTPIADAINIPEDVGAYQAELDFEAPCDSGYCFV